MWSNVHHKYNFQYIKSFSVWKKWQEEKSYTLISTEMNEISKKKKYVKVQFITAAWKCLAIPFSFYHSVQCVCSFCEMLKKRHALIVQPGVPRGTWGHQHQLSEWILLRLNQNTWELQLIPHYWCVEGPAGLQFTLCCDFLLSVFLCLLFAWYTGDKSPEAGNMSVALVFCCKNIILFLCANMCYCLTKKEGITRQTEVCWLMKLEQLRGRSSSSSINTHWDIFMFNDKREKNFLCRIFLTWPQIKAQ